MFQSCSDDLIFILMSKLLGNEFFCGSYCASRLLPGSPGQELHMIILIGIL